jgi:hypothetical protein
MELMQSRILARRLASELSSDDVEAVAAGHCYATPSTICSTAIEGAYDATTCDGGLDCDF